MIQEAMYKDVSAVALESEAISAVFLPGYGGKLTSVYGKKRGREYLAQAKGKTYLLPSYGEEYILSESAGFDDMFPTIDACYCAQHPWKGVEMPDHGEVYSLPWQYSIKDETLCMAVCGVRFPYRLEKTVRIENQCSLVTEYTLLNLSPFDFDFLWAAHCMLAAEENARIDLPYQENAPAVWAFSSDAALGKPGEPLCWPVVNGRDLSVTEISSGLTAKYFFAKELPGSRCSYRYPDGCAIHMDIDRQTVPYLAVWHNEGWFHGLESVAFEACTCRADRPDVAKQLGSCSVLKAGETYRWYCRLTVDE